MAKRRISLILAILILGALLFGGEEITRVAVQRGLSGALHVPVRIRRLSFSPGQVTLHGVRLAGSSSTTTAPLAIQRIRIEGSPLTTLGRWLFRHSVKDGTQETLTVTGLTVSVSGVPLQAGGRVTVTAEAGKPAWCEGWLTLDHPMARGEIEISGPALEPVLFGWVEGPFGRRNFIAQLAVKGDTLSLERVDVQGGWSARGSATLPRDGAWNGEMEAAGPDGRYKLEASSSRAGKVQAVLSIYREGQEPRIVSASWSVRRSLLELNANLLGKQAVIGGEVDLRPPHGMDLKLDFNGMDLEQMMDWYLPGVVESQVSGVVRGSVLISGRAESMVSVGELFGTEGSFGPLKFDAITLRFRGRGPILQIRDSQILKPRGAVAMEGMVDLRKIGHPDFFKAVKLHSTEPGFFEVLGLELSSAQRGGGVRVGRTAGKDGPRMGLTFRRDDTMPQETLERQELDVEYPLTAQEHVNFRLQGEEEILSVEHRRKF